MIEAADVDAATGDSGGRVVDRPRGTEPPALDTGGCVERIEVAVVAADVEYTSLDARPRDHAAARTKLPYPRAAVGAERVDTLIITPDPDSAPRDGRRGIDSASGRVAPPLIAGLRVEGVDVVVAAANVKRAVRNCG